MDGNRRFAREKGLPSVEGHRRGYSKFKEVLSWTKEAGIRNVIVYVLSIENWKRSKEEVSYLLELMRTMLKKELKEVSKEKTRLIFAGDLSRFPEDIQQLIAQAHEKTADYTDYTLVVAASYGGRAEILSTVNKLIAKGTNKPVSEEDFEKELWTAGVPDPDLIIRTGGVERLSNFLPWQAVYSELFFTKTYWPDFNREEFESILKKYSLRERRHGR